jgi:hypothetical protein
VYVSRGRERRCARDIHVPRVRDASRHERDAAAKAVDSLSERRGDGSIVIIIHRPLAFALSRRWQKTRIVRRYVPAPRAR